MRIDFLRDISVIVGGKNAGQVADLLVDKKNVNEFIIAKKLGLTINQTRNILYKLADDGLVSSIRKKDKKKGWYTYFWTFNTDKALILLQKIILKDIEQLGYKLKSRELKRFYICKTCNTEISEENALLNDFVCPECGQIYELNNNKKAITEITSSINKLNKRLEEINSELAEIGVYKLKKVQRARKKEEKEKSAKRKATFAKISAKRLALKKIKLKLADKLKSRLKRKIKKKIKKGLKKLKNKVKASKKNKRAKKIKRKRKI